MLTVLAKAIPLSTISPIHSLRKSLFGIYIKYEDTVLCTKDMKNWGYTITTLTQLTV